jgi:Protein related to penicillin acylase
MVPVPGNGDWDWLGYRRPEEWPQVLDPPRGYIVTANHKVTPEGFPYALTYDWAEPYRARRIEELILGKEKLSLEDMKAIQQDQKSLLYRDFRPVLELLSPLSERARVWRERLLAWDGAMAASSEEALVFALWYTELTRLPEREVGEAYWDEPRYLLRAMREGDKNCDQPETEYKETCLDYAALALERALERKEALKARAWGEVHRAGFAHAVLSHTPLKRLSDRALPFGGDRYTVNVGPFDPRTLRMDHGPSYRQIVDLADMEASLFVHPMGQSGHFLSPHYADLLPLWARGVLPPHGLRRGGEDPPSGARPLSLFLPVFQLLEVLQHFPHPLVDPVGLAAEEELHRLVHLLHGVEVEGPLLHRPHHLFLQGEVGEVGFGEHHALGAGEAQGPADPVKPLHLLRHPAHGQNPSRLVHGPGHRQVLPQGEARQGGKNRQKLGEPRRVPFQAPVALLKDQAHGGG